MAYPATRAHMRKLRRLTDTPSCGGPGVDTECTVDRLTNLPEGVAHVVLSFLTIRDLTRFGSLSKRCRELYLSTPRLNFRLEEVDTCDEWSRFLDSVDRFLNLREHQIHHFCIRWLVWHLASKTPCNCDYEKDRIIPWINNALGCKVEVLDIEFRLFGKWTPFEFPSCIFLCGSLRTLSLQMYYKPIKAPSLACLSNLECLNLRHVAIDEGFFKWISLSCKSLKELRLDRVHVEQDITIESTSLKSVSFVTDKLRYLEISGEKLEDIHIEYYSAASSLRCTPLNIFAPNLKYLTWVGNTVDHQLGRLLHLEKAEILRPIVCGKDKYGKIFDLFCTISKVRVLTICNALIEALFKEGSMPVPPLHDVSYLRIYIGSFSDKLMAALASLLREMPNLSTLYMNSSLDLYGGIDSRNEESERCSGYGMEYWKSQDLPLISQLKEVTIELSAHSYGSNQIEFSSFILEHVENLKKMVIVHPSRLEKSLNELKKSKKTLNVEVVFLMK